MKTRIKRFLLAIIVSPVASAFSIVILEIAIAMLRGSSTESALVVGQATALVSLYVMLPASAIVGVPAFLILERLNVRLFVAYPILGLALGYLIAGMLFPGPQEVMYLAALGGTVAGATFRALVEPRLSSDT